MLFQKVVDRLWKDNLVILCQYMLPVSRWRISQKQELVIPLCWMWIQVPVETISSPALPSGRQRSTSEEIWTTFWVGWCQKNIYNLPNHSTKCYLGLQTQLHHLSERCVPLLPQWPRKSKAIRSFKVFLNSLLWLMLKSQELCKWQD